MRRLSALWGCGIRPTGWIMDSMCRWRSIWRSSGEDFPAGKRMSRRICKARSQMRKTRSPRWRRIRLWRNQNSAGIQGNSGSLKKWTEFLFLWQKISKEFPAAQKMQCMRDVHLYEEEGLRWRLHKESECDRSYFWSVRIAFHRKKFSEQMILKQTGIIMDFANLKHGKKL